MGRGAYAPGRAWTDVHRALIPRFGQSNIRPMRVLSVDGRPAAKARDFLAVRLGIAQYAASAALVIFVVLLSGAGRQHLTAALVTAAVASAYAAFQAFVPASPRLLPLFAFGSGLFVVNTSVAIAATGGSHSPLRVLLIFSVVYAAWYYERRPAAAIMASVMVADLLPLAYDRRGVHPEELGLTVALRVVLVLAGWLMLVGRRETDRLRARARPAGRRPAGGTAPAARRAATRSPTWRTAGRSSATSRSASRVAATRIASASCSSTSTASRTSTPPSATPAATRR